MSPILEPTVLELRQYGLRHIGPKALVFPDTIGQSYTVLNRSDLVARPLPQANIPNTVDFASGAWTGRLYDAADGTVTFPNKEASDGVPWRMRFDPTNKLQWIEMWIDEYLEAALCVTKVTPDRNQVKIDCYDGFQMTKSAYTRDATVVSAPRDVIERGTQLWSPSIVDNFPTSTTKQAGVYTTPYGTWTEALVGSGVTSLAANGGIKLSVGAVANDRATISSPNANFSGTLAWSAQCLITAGSFAAGQGGFFDLEVDLTGPSIHYFLSVYNGYATVGSTSPTTNISSVALPAGQLDSITLRLESDGEWVMGYVSGALVGMFRVSATPATAAQVQLNCYSAGSAASLVVQNILFETLAPFLMASPSDKGDYVLPGSATTYPVGGLHARYYNDADLAGDANRLLRIMNPGRAQAYGGSGVPEYQNQQDATINGGGTVTQPPFPGVPSTGGIATNWSVKWFGSIYLKLSQGNYTFTITVPNQANNFACRIWIGKLGWGSQLLDGGTTDRWAFTNTANQVFTYTVTASALAGTLSYGGNTVQRDGWYPIRIEYAVDSTVSPSNTLPTFKLTNSPAAYTDPGGTSISSGAQSTVVPSSSLSPLGCVDTRYQATSHFDLVQKTAIAFGYQFSVEPKQLESGSFPGVLAPRLREGADYDPVIEPDDAQRREGMLNYSSTTDGTDQASSMFGNGAGFQNGQTGQLQGYVFDPATLQNALFDMQAWQDAADASYLSLLGATLTSELSLRLAPWTMVSGDPVGRQRLAYTWPLPGSIQQFRWRPGDGVRLLARDINIQDTAPRQLLLVTRNIHPNGVTSTQVGFAARPKTGSYANRKALAAALRPQRNYQRQLVTLNSNFLSSAAAPGASVSSQVALQPGDMVKTARLRIGQNSGAVALQIVVNGTNDTTGTNTLKAPAGGFINAPLNLDVTSLVASAPGGANPNSLTVAVKNSSGVTTSTIDVQLFVDVVR